CVEKGVGGAIIRLAESAYDRTARRAEDEEIKLLALKRAFERAQAFHFRSQHSGRHFPRLYLNHASTRDARGMDDPVDTPEALLRHGDQRPYLFFIGHVRPRDHDLRAHSLNLNELLYLLANFIAGVRGQMPLPQRPVRKL